MNGDRGKIRIGDAIAVAALLLVAFIPARWVASPDWRPLSVDDRIRLTWESVNRHAFAQGTLPVWDPYQFGGRPHLANPQTLVLYPPYLVSRLLPLELFFSVNLAFHAWVAGIGAYLIARQLHAAPVASLAGGIAAMFGTVLAPSIGLADSAGVLRVAWIPLAIAFAMRSTQRSHLLPHPGLVITVVMALFTASARGALYVVAAVIGWYAFAVLYPAGPPASPRRRLTQLGILFGLSIGLTAVQSVPAARFQLSTSRADGLQDDHPKIDVAPMNAALLARPPRGRAMSGCGHTVDAQFVALEIPTVGGYGGRVDPEYVRFTTLAGSRADLLSLLDAEYLVACDGPDRRGWDVVTQADGVGVYRNRTTVGRAVWTCAPHRVGPNEFEYEVRRTRYDATLKLHRRGHVIHVRWVPGITDGERHQAEARFRIAPERFLNDRTWQYELLDPSRSNVGAIVRSPVVEDTAGVDRATFDLITAARPVFDTEPKSEWLIGAAPCTDDGYVNVLAKDRADGKVVVDVEAPRDGVLFLSETYSPERRAWVDGEPVEPLKVNLALTAVPVKRGRHRVELRYDTRMVRLGAGMFAVTLILWSVGAWRQGAS